MRKIIYFLSLLSMLQFIACRQSGKSSEELNIGIGVVDITGDDAFILDPLNVKAIVFRQGTEQIAIVECDLIEVSYELASAARKEASERTGIQVGNICVAATHTHMSRYTKEVQPAIVEAIIKAQGNLQPASIKSTIGQEFNVAFNRRYFMKDNTVKFNPMFLNPNIVRPVGPIDPDVGFVLISNKENTPVASLTNYALHLDIVKEYGARYQKNGAGAENAVSADYPYWLEKQFRREYGEGFNSIFLTGCCGNINHWDFSKPGPQSGHKTKSKQVGDSLYVAIKRALPNAEEEIAALKASHRIVDVPLQSFTDEDVKWAEEKKNQKLSSKSEEMDERKIFLEKIRMKKIFWAKELEEQGITTLPLDVQVFRLGNRTAIVTLPGEMFVEHGMTIKNFSPFENTIVVELANSSDIAYVPNKTAFSQGGYEVVNSRLAPGGGEMLVKAAIDMLNELDMNSGH